MAYADIFATEARGMWSPPNGAAPQMIPDKWRDNPGDELRYDLPDKTDDELVALGWKKVDDPSYTTLGASFFNNRYEWNSSTRTYDAIELEDFEKQQGVEYNKFWRNLLDSNFYRTFKAAASSELAANVIYTEFICLIEDAKTDPNIANISKIQASLKEIIAGVTLTTEERAEFQTLIDSTGMGAVYTLS
tara:strand:+ start:11005 stop:11574 length:570 start_codon:yes stop_codon:yes gene_type:complete